MSAVVFYYRRSEFTTDSKNLLSVVFLVREGPLGRAGLGFFFFLLKNPTSGGSPREGKGGAGGAGEVSAGNLGGCIRVKQARFGKLAFLQQNGALFWPKKRDFRLFRATFSVKNV